MRAIRGWPKSSFDCVAIMGNWFGYFSNKQDNEKVLYTRRQGCCGPAASSCSTSPTARTCPENFDRRSWEWIDEHHFVCRERSISAQMANG